VKRVKIKLWFSKTRKYGKIVRGVASQILNNEQKKARMRGFIPLEKGKVTPLIVTVQDRLFGDTMAQLRLLVWQGRQPRKGVKQ